MSLCGLLNNTFSTYHQAKGLVWPYDEGVWTKVIDAQPCYVSAKSLDRVNEDGTLIRVNTLRIRSEPYTNNLADLVYLNGVMYEQISYEDIDGLGREAVTIVQRKNMSAAEIAEITT